MKKIVLLSILGLFFYTGLVSATEYISVCNPPAGLWVKFELKLHRPKLDCLRGFGICFDVTAGWDEDHMISSDQPMCPVRGRLTEKKQLVVELTSEALNKYEGGSSLPFFKGKSSIVLSDPYSLSAATCKALGSGGPITIKPGEYPVAFSNGIYTVVFQL